MRDIMLIAHFIGLVMGLGTGFAHAFLSSAAAKMEPGEALRFRLHSLVLSKMGNIGIILLIISGFYLIIPYWSVLTEMPLLMIKLLLVLTLIIVISIINVLGRKAMKGDAQVHFKKMANLGKFTLIIGIAIVIIAVNVFH